VLGYLPSLLLLALLLQLMLPLKLLPAADQHQEHQLACHCWTLAGPQQPHVQLQTAMGLPALLHSSESTVQHHLLLHA
jgi:hypothetical protein